jgi:hypothetical protein
VPRLAQADVPAIPHFPPLPRLRGRSAEIATLTRAIEATAPTCLALVGAGGSGKSMLAAALGHQLARRFENRVHWFRVGAWDSRTMGEMLALRFGTSRARASLFPELRALLAEGSERLIVLDNHEDDPSMARFLDALAGTRATFVITARRCLLAGVLVFPVNAPLVTSGRSAFPRVARLTRTLRWNPLALDIADGIVASGSATLAELSAFLEANGVGRVRVIDHEDDLPEVALLVDWAWRRLAAGSRRVLAVLSCVEGDSVDHESLAQLSRTRDLSRALAPLERWRLIQVPLRGRCAIHAVVRYTVKRRTVGTPDRVFEHYISLLEREPGRLMLEQTHLFAAMDYAYRAGNISSMLRVESLLDQLDRAG